jgi:ATP-dependent DNA helicase RecQ
VENKIKEAINKAAKDIGYEKLSGPQQTAIFEFIKGNDVFLLLPTGSGKSLCYILLPLVFDYLRQDASHHTIALVISPLHSLIEDQIAKYSSKGITCAHIFQNQTKAVQDLVLKGSFQIIFMSPETLLKELKWRVMFRSKTYTDNLIAVAVDEVHCIEKF